MPVRSNAIAVRHFQADSKVSRRSHRITFEHCQLSSRRQNRRDGAEFDLVRAEYILGYGRRDKNRGTNQESQQRKAWTTKDTKFHEVRHGPEAFVILRVPRG